MNWENVTKLQHFVSQAEQRLNAINPKALQQNQKIYEFEIIDREALEIRLVNPNGRNISNSLAYLDLFSFDVGQDKLLRNNFESSFNRYEASIKTITESLIQKLSIGKKDVNIKDEIVNIFLAKLLNLARNPFSIHKTLNTFGILTNYFPVLPEHQAAFDRILNGRKPHQKRLCQEFGISDLEYQQWLHMLFMLFVPTGESGLNMLESIVRKCFIDSKFAIQVLVSSYTFPQCLLSDRSFSTNINETGYDGFDFNLTSHAFIRYIFADIDKFQLPEMPIEILNSTKERYKALPREINVIHDIDNIDLLKRFNTNVIYQSSNHVYCATKNPLV